VVASSILLKDTEADAKVEESYLFLMHVFGELKQKTPSHKTDRDFKNVFQTNIEIHKHNGINFQFQTLAFQSKE
jgi:hypothetical protein